MSELLEGIKEAIQDERDAQRKYKELREQTTDKQAQALYSQLIEDEKNHEKILLSRYEAVKKSLESR